MNTNVGFYLLLSVFLLPVGAGAQAITALELKEARETGEVRAIVDVRSGPEFERGHIPGAINVPHFVIEEKTLPPFGLVVVYGDGLGRIDEEAVAEALNRKTGIRARLLAGGFAAWESEGLQTTHRKGLSDVHVPVITYQQLEKAQARGIVLADLRRRGGPQRALAPDSADDEPPSPTDLRALFPAARVVEPGRSAGTQTDGPVAASAAASGRGNVVRELASVKAEEELIVLIDDGDGSAERTAIELRSAGNKRVVVLAGGEAILQRAGRSGRGRVGYGFAEGPADRMETPEQPVEGGVVQ